jgi:hypothetical protein
VPVEFGREYWSEAHKRERIAALTDKAERILELLERGRRPAGDLSRVENLVSELEGLVLVADMRKAQGVRAEELSGRLRAALRHE